MVFANLVHTLISPRWAGLHFALIGALLFGVQQSLHVPLGAAASGRVDVSQTDLVDRDWESAPDEALLYREALRRGLDRGDPVVRRRLVQDMRFLALAESGGVVGDDQALYREALVLGLDRSDRVVRRRLVERARASLIAQAPMGSPTDEVLRAHLAANAERFVQPERRQIEQLYFARRDAAHQALTALRGEASASDEFDPSKRLGRLDRLGESLPLPRELPSLSQRELAARLGPEFARHAVQLAGGRWSGPIRSSYGEHLVRVSERSSERVPTLDEVRRALTSHWISEQETRSLRDALEELRRAYAAEASRQPS